MPTSITMPRWMAFAFASMTTITLITSISLIISITLQVGCVSQPKASQTDERTSEASSFFSKAKGTGIDPRAREIERNLGYE